MNPAETEQALKAARRGEQTAYRCLFEAFSPLVFGTAMRFAESTAEAEELTQDIFFKAFGALETYNNSIASFATWLRRIAYNTCVSYLRSAPQLPYKLLDEGQTLPEEQVTNESADPEESRIEMLMSAVETLPPEEQHLLTLRYFESLNLQEMAYITNLSPAALSSRLNRIRNKLHKILTRPAS